MTMVRLVSPYHALGQALLVNLTVYQQKQVLAAGKRDDRASMP
jgi:hypothetical protein